MLPVKKIDFTQLIPLEECAEMNYDTPYVYTFESPERKLSVCGAAHSHDSSHKQYDWLRAYFSKKTPDIVLLEGLQDEVVFSELHHLLKNMDEEMCITRGGEAVFAAKLALEAGANFTSSEPKDKDLVQYLEHFGFLRRDIVAWYMLRLLPQYIRRQETLSFQAYVEPFMEQLQQVTTWSEAMERAESVLAYATTIVEKDIALHSETLATAYTSPLATSQRDNDYTLLNTIAATATEYRDRAMVREVCHSVEHFDDVLVVYGASHAVRQEPLLGSLCG